MNIIRQAIDRPVAVISAVLMVVLFGFVALQAIPIQLAPDVRQPVLTVETIWPEASPAEMEREVLVRQEDVIRGIQGLERMTGRAETGRSRLELEFRVDTNMDRALLLVSNRLDRISDYPDTVDEPTLDTSGSEDNPIAWFIFTRLAGNDRPIHEYGDFVEDVVRERVERVPGVGRINVFGGSEQQLEIIVDPSLMARYNLTVGNVVDTLRAANIATSAGDVKEGKRRYVVRTQGELNQVKPVEDIVLRSNATNAVAANGTRQFGRITVADIAEVRFSHKEPTARIRFNGEPGMAMNAVRETGANVLETMQGIQATLATLNESTIPGAGLQLEQVYDETIYIDSAISLVNQNIYVGGALAAIILMLFLRSLRATLVVSLAIPVSIIGAFVAMAALGRSINVISLAGLAFAIGMVVDAAIVVLENIYRLREKGYSSREAAYEGARQVWGAIFVSAATTVMVFIPILIMELEVGQLFRDIAVAISVAVVLSLVVAVTVVPALARSLLGFTSKEEAEGSVTRMRIPGVDHIASGAVTVIMAFQRLMGRSRALSAAVVLGVTVAAAVSAWAMMPKMEYLPEGNRNLVLGVIAPPPGYNLDTTFEIASYVESQVKPLWSSVSGPEPEEGGPPKISRFFFVATRGTTFIGAAAEQDQRVSELIPVLREPVFEEPGTFGFINQPSIFGRGIGGGRKIDLDIQGEDLNDILSVARRAAGRIAQALPFDEGHQLRPNPGLELGAPELQVQPNRTRLSDAGVSARDLAQSLSAFNNSDGLRVEEVTVGTKRMDLSLRGPADYVGATQGIGELPVLTPTGMILPIGSLASVQHTAGPTEIRHVERDRTVTLEIRPAPRLPLESAAEILQSEVIEALQAEGLPPGTSMVISGTADKLTETWEAMAWDLLLALIIVFLVMAVLFESFIYPFIMMLAVPVAAVGGIGGLALLNLLTYQPLDMLTLLGFVILIGIVVNNAILLVHQTLYLVREVGREPAAAIEEATRNRIRPIFMSTLTSVCGMLPLVVFPGAGSELYRGLGSVVVGGLSVSAVITLLIVPPMMTLMVEPMERRARDRAARNAGAEKRGLSSGAVPHASPGE